MFDDEEGVISSTINFSELRDGDFFSIETIDEYGNTDEVSFDRATAIWIAKQILESVGEDIDSLT